MWRGTSKYPAIISVQSTAELHYTTEQIDLQVAPSAAATALTMFYFIFYFGVISITAGVAYGDQTYLTKHTIIATWNDARLRCEQKGGHLASPITNETWMAMKSLMSNNTMYHIGTSAGHTPGTYFSVEGVPLEAMSAVVKNMMQELDPEEGDCMAMDHKKIRFVPCWTRLQYMCTKPSNSSKPVNTIITCGPMEDGYTYNSTTRKCYKVHRDGEYTWDEGSLICGGEGGRLAIVENKDELQAVMSLYTFNEYYWIFIGLRDVTGKGDWWTSEGVPATYDNWLPDQGTDSEQSCGSVHYTRTLYNAICDIGKHFICERKPTHCIPV